MIENNNKTPAISIINQRRKSSPECFFPFTKSASPSNFLLQKQKDDNKDQETSNWIQSRKQSFKEVFHHSSNKNQQQQQALNNINKTVISSSPSSSPLLLLDDNNTATTTTNTRFLRSYSETRYSPPFSSISSSNSSSYFSSSSYANSITLPAAPVLGGSAFSSIKKNKKIRSLLLRASITGSSSDLLFKQPQQSTESSDKMMMMVPSNNASPSPSNHRNSTSSDIELATEIGQGLLSEVRRMQSILQERQDSLISLELERTDNQQRIDDLLKQLRYKNESEERLKEDIWNLELTKQDLSHQIRQLSQSIAKTQMEQVRRERQSSLVLQELELLKASQLNWQEMMTKTQTDYESTLSNLNQQLAKLKKEKDAIASQLEKLSKAQKDAQEQEQEDEIKQRKISEQEIKSLQISLVLAHNVVKNLQLDLEKEKQKKSEVDALLRESQETIEAMQKKSPSQQDIVTIVRNGSTDNESSTSSLEKEIESTESRINIERYGSILMKESDTTDTTTPTCSQITTSTEYLQSYENRPIHPLSPIHHPNGFEKVLPFVMHTMIGEWLLKYTRNRVGNGISNKSHQRFFWLHPYTKTLYWSQQEPGVKGGEYKAKSVSIESFFVDQQQQDGDSQPVIVIKSSARDIRLQCINKDSHEKWIQSLNDLLKDDDNNSSAATLPRQRNSSNLKLSKNKRLSLLLENAPPSTIRQKQKWRMSEATLDSSPIVQQQQQQVQPQRNPSTIRFSSLRVSHKS